MFVVAIMRPFNWSLAMFTWVILGIGLSFPTVHLLLVAKDRSPGNVGRIYLSYLLPLSVGLGGLFAFLGHTMRADDVARSIGWPAGNPFQTEVAMTNLAFGALGLLCVKFRDGFWTATILGYGIFLEGAALVHIREILLSGNWSINNAGPILVADVAFPILQMYTYVHFPLSCSLRSRCGVAWGEVAGC